MSAPDDRNEPVGGADPDDPPEPADIPVDVAPSQRRRLNVTVLLILSAAGAYLLGRMIWPFLGGLGAALVVAVLAHPKYRWLRERTSHESVAALVATALVFLLVLLPLAALSLALLNSFQENADTLAVHVENLLAPDGIAARWLDGLVGSVGAEDTTFAEQIRTEIGSMGGRVAGQTVGFVSGVGGAFLQIGVAMFTVYYFLRDGEEILATTARVLPIDPELTESLAHRSGDIIRATMFGNVAVAFVQGGLGGLAFWALDIPGPILWGAVMALLGLLPVVGTPLVWVPAAVILLAQGHLARALALLAFGALVISTVDNILRAKLVSDRAQLHPLAVFVSVLGGVVLFGMMGLFLGPLFFVVAMSLLEVAHGVLQPDADDPA